MAECEHNVFAIDLAGDVAVEGEYEAICIECGTFRGRMRVTVGDAGDPTGHVMPTWDLGVVYRDKRAPLYVQQLAAKHREINGIDSDHDRMRRMFPRTNRRVP